MAIKAVFFDIDGTLLNDMKKVSRSTLDAIQQLRQAGILVGIATGRGPAFVEPYMENLGFDFAVTYNGQYIISRDQVIYQEQLPKPTLYRLIRYAAEHGKELSLGTSSGLVGSGIIRMGTSAVGQVISSFIPKRFSKSFERGVKKLVRRVRPQKHDRLLTLMREPIFQAVLVATAEQTRQIETLFPQVTITRSSPYSADIIAKGQSKLKGISRLAEQFGFDMSEVMAFGDSDNDFDMLAGVGLGVAMGNAHHRLKSIARYTTASNNQDGISKALAHYGLITLSQDKSFKSRDDNFNKVKAFHRLMDGQTCETPRLYGMTEASHRADFKLEEIVEFLYAASQGDAKLFQRGVADLHVALDKAATKVASKPVSSSPLVSQVDALIDLLYFTYGSFVLMGVDPKPLFDTVHEANMGKIFPDGKAHFDPVTHKILKPDHWEDQFAPEPHLKRELDRQIAKSFQKR